MGFRETLANMKMSVLVVCALVVLLVLAFVFQRSSTRQSGGPEENRSFYTIDDGKTWFKDDAGKIPPFIHEGKTAYRCYVYTCDGGKTQFVGYMERLNPEAKKKFELPGGNKDLILMAGMEFKAPGTGDADWIAYNDPRAVNIKIPRCPDGQELKPESVSP